MKNSEKVKFLEQRIKDLEALVAAQRELLELKTKPLSNGTLTVPQGNGWITIQGSPNISLQAKCADGQCQYPNPWGATVPPSCNKCGHQAQPCTQWSIVSGSTCQGGTTQQVGGDLGYATSGYVQVIKD